MLYCDKVSILLRDEGRFYHSFFYVFHARKVCKHHLFQGKFLADLPKKYRVEQPLEPRFAPL